MVIKVIIEILLVRLFNLLIKFNVFIIVII